LDCLLIETPFKVEVDLEPRIELRVSGLLRFWWGDTGIMPGVPHDLPELKLFIGNEKDGYGALGIQRSHGLVYERGDKGFVSARECAKEVEKYYRQP
jgi:hypothetical protein